MFFQKRMPTRGVPAWVQTARSPSRAGVRADELCPTDLAHVAWAAQMGTIVFHPWPVRAADVDSPDELRIDLDPQPGTDFADAAAAAGEVRAVLDELGWTGWPKTSGGRGVHVYIRIAPQLDVHRGAPGRDRAGPGAGAPPSRPGHHRRGGRRSAAQRVFLDYNQMARDRTIACAYSLRANARATVSTPVTWDELPDVEPDDFDLRHGAARGSPSDRRPARRASTTSPHDITPAAGVGRAGRAAPAQGDLPYPPDHPKMPGEPQRVQPSRAKRPADEIAG